MLSSSERWRRIKEEEALQQEGEGKRKDGEENHPYTLYIALYSSHSKDSLKKVTSFGISCISDANGEFLLEYAMLCSLFYVLNKTPS